MTDVIPRAVFKQLRMKISIVCILAAVSITVAAPIPNNDLVHLAKRNRGRWCTFDGNFADKQIPKDSGQFLCRCKEAPQVPGNLEIPFDFKKPPAGIDPKKPNPTVKCHVFFDGHHMSFENENLEILIFEDQLKLEWGKKENVNQAFIAGKDPSGADLYSCKSGSNTGWVKKDNMGVCTILAKDGKTKQTPADYELLLIKA